MNENILNTGVQEFINKNWNADIVSVLLKRPIFQGISQKELVEQLEAKKKCRNKLPTWFNTPNIYYPNKLNIEQTSSEKTARYKAGLVKGKTLLEVGCGHADLGKRFNDMGAIVTSTDGRQEHIDVVKQRYPELESFQLDVDCEWNLNRKFDVIIHFGVLYHLSNWKENLKATLDHTDLVIFETEKN